MSVAPHIQRERQTRLRKLQLICGEQLANQHGPRGPVR